MSMLTESVQAWAINEWKRALELPNEVAAPPPGIYRIEIDEDDLATWLVTPDYLRIARFKKPIQDVTPSLWMCKLEAGCTVVDAVRIGRGNAVWPKATA